MDDLASSKLRELRRRAEELLEDSGREESDSFPHRDIMHLVHELEVHQIELQIQNEELRAASKSLEESRRAYAELYNLAPIGYVTTDGNGIVTSANYMALNLLNVSADRFMGLAFFIFIHPEDRETYNTLIAKAGAGKEAKVSGEMRLMKDKAEPFHAQVEIAPSRVESGRFTGWRIIFGDISERKQMEEELKKAKDDLADRVRARTKDLRRSEEKYRELVQNANSIIMRTDSKGDITFFNEFAQKFFGYTEEEILGQNIVGTIVPESESSQRYIPVMAENLLREPERYASREAENMRRNGERVWIAWTHKPILDEHGNLTGVLCIGNDITKRRRAELALEEANQARLHAERERSAAALQESEERYRALIEASSQVLYRMNQDWSEMRQLQGGSFIADTEKPKLNWIQEYIPPDDQEKVVEAIDEVVRTGTVFELEHRVKRVDGTLGWTFSRAVPVRNAAGEIVEWFGAASDITERKQAEEALQKAHDELELRVRERTAQLEAINRKLEQRNKELEDFAFISSHHVQEPLRKIMTFSDRLRARFGDMLNQEAEDYIDRMHKAVKRIQTLIRDLLRYSRISADTGEFAPVDLFAVVQDVLSEFDRFIEGAGARVEVSKLPAIDADAMQIKKVFTHLFENALKFRSKNDPFIKIYSRTRSIEGKEAVDIYVEDNGIGFDEKYLDRIFSPFQQLHSKGRYEGTGMGLAICRRIVEMHNGSITAKSEPGEGATFIVSLPVCQERREESP